jgi:hypothetical protein
MPQETGRAPFVTKEDSYGNKSTVTLIFMNDGSVRWEMPVDDSGLPPRPAGSLFPTG